MKVAYFDCQFGAAGDMLLGALCAAGLPQEKWQAELAKIALPSKSFAVEVTAVIRCSIAATKVDVHIYEDEHRSSQHSHDHEHEHDDDHEHEHEHTHDEMTHSHAHSHDDEHAHGHSREHAHGRNLPEILQIIDASAISSRAKELAKRIFQKLGEAEAKVHGLPIEQVHFHEVGAVDAIVDIVGFAIAYDLLGIERSVVSALPVGSGRIKTQHGLFPIPAPAVVNLLADAKIPVASSPFTHECLTPTGAAILAVVCETAGTMPAMTISHSGYGAGTYDPQGFPNVCRVVIGTADTQTKNGDIGQSQFNSEVIAVVETNVDDLSPQVLAFAMERLFESGALDVSITPVVMKKGRSGHLLTCICRPTDRVAMQKVMLNHTSSLGVRSYLCERLAMEREWREITLEHGGTVRIKIGFDRQGNVVNAQPEYEDCAEYARKHGLPLKEVILKALARLEPLG